MLRFVALLVLNLWCSSLAYAGSVWFSDAQGIHRIDTDTGMVVQSIPQDDVHALVLNQKDGTLWALSAGRLRKYDALGVPVLDLDLKTLATNFNAARRLALDPADDSVWVAGGNNVFHLDAGGAALAGFDSPAIVEDIALAQDQTLWVLGRNELARYSTQALLGRAELAGDMQQAAFLAIDDANGSLWLAGARKLFRLAIELPLRPLATLATGEVVSAIALAADSGTLWIAGQSTLFGFARDGTPAAATPLARGIVNLQVLGFDAASQSVWLGHEKGISRFGLAGQYLATLAAAVRVDTISAAPSGIVPTVALVSPANDALTNNALVPIRLHYDASCFGQPCGFPGSVFAAYVLTATLNGQSIGHLFRFDAATHDAVYTPAARHPEGVNEFQAFVTDGEGRRSRSIASRFTVDTVAPSFVSVAPPDGATFASAGITLQGSIDDMLGSVLLESFSGATVTGPNPAGQFFAYQITLQPGTNVFRLTAGDPAGNARPLPLTYVFSSLTLTIASPASNATVDDNKVTVTGSFSGAATAAVTVNGISAVVTGTAFSAADVPLAFGPNALTAVAVSPQGARDTKTVTVNSTFPSVTITSPANGTSIAGDKVLVRGRIQAPPNSGVSVNDTVAAVDGSGNFFAVVQLVAGPNALTATVASPSRKMSVANVAVVATGQPPAMLATAAPATGLAPLAVTFTVSNPTADNATFMFDTFGPFSLPAQSSSTLTVTYPAGVFVSSIVVTDALGGVTRETFVIDSKTPAELDALLRSVWSAMNDALVAGDRAQAMNFLDNGAQAKYGPVFDALMPHFAQIVASYSAPQMASLKPDVGEYVVGRTVNGTRRVFFIYFVRDVDGVWRISEM